jgi:uncharacterized protein (DUF302 family)
MDCGGYMLKVIGGFVVGILATLLVTGAMVGKLMFREVPSPFGVEETAARIQANIQAQKDKGWSLSGLRDPVKPLQATGENALPVLLIEACSTRYSGPMLKDDKTRILSILMPCTITVYKKNDGKTYVGLMNAGLMGRLFGSKMGEIMNQVAVDQASFVTFDPSQPAPPLIKGAPGGGSGGAGKDAGGGC